MNRGFFFLAAGALVAFGTMRAPDTQGAAPRGYSQSTPGGWHGAAARQD